MNAFNKFKVQPPSDIGKIIANLDKSSYPEGPTYSELKPDDTWETWSSRKRAEHKKKEDDRKNLQRQEFDKASPEPETPDSWRTQSVEFEHKLVARLRRL
jgi:hypothetical protein